MCLLPNNRVQMLKENGSAKLRWIHIYKFLKISEFCGSKVVVLHIDTFRETRMRYLPGRQKNGYVMSNSTSYCY